MQSKREVRSHSRPPGVGYSGGEVWEVFRRRAEQNASWDEVEVIVSGYATFAPIIHAETSNLSVSCTHSKGLTMLFSQAGQVATLLVSGLGGFWL